MASARTPPSPTFFPTTRLRNLSNPSYTSHSQAPTRAFLTSRSPPASRRLSSSTHLLRDLEPRTYDSGSDAGSTFEGYKDSPPTATTAGQGLSQPQLQWERAKGKDIPVPRNRSRSRKWPKARRFEGRSTYNDVGEHDERRRDEQARSYADEPDEQATYGDSLEEQHPLDPTPQPISRRRSRAEEELPRWARSTEAGRLGLEREATVKLETVRPGWLKAQQKQETVKFSIPPPITESLLLPSNQHGASRRPNVSEESILSSIFGAFPGTGRRDETSGDSAVVGRNRVSKLGEEWTSLIRQERVLQSQIQSLLDQQSAGLRAVETEDKSVSRTSSMRRNDASVRSSTTLNGRGDRMEKPGRRTLHVARMELLKAMYTLIDLAAAKEAVLTETSQSLEAAHRQLSNWQLNLSVAEAKIQELGPGNGDGPGTDDRIWKELQEVEPLIADLERKLKVAKERKKRLQQQQKESRSVREADAARWVEAKREIDRDVGRWMREPSIPSDMLESDQYWAKFLKLPAGRRNLDAAVENLGGAIRALRKRLAGAQTEHDVCERGAGLWSEALEAVLKAEQAIKTWMQRSLQGKGDPMDNMIGFMEGTQAELEGHMEVARKEGWNLIVSALGAEIDAWREGLEIVRRMTGKSNTSGKANGKQASETRHESTRFENLSSRKEVWKEMSSVGGPTVEHSDEKADSRRRRGHSVNTQSTEDPMWGSGLDKDAELFGELELGLGLEDKDPGPLNDAKIEMRDIREFGIDAGLNRRTTGPPEECHAIITEGLHVSPAPSPWKSSKPNSPVKATLKVEENSQPGTPDREASFRTAMEHSIVVDETKDGKEDGEPVKQREGSESPEALTAREQRRPSHMRKGVVEMDGGGEESDDGEVPVDLLG